MLGQHAGMAGGDDADLASALMKPARRLDADDAAALAADAGDFAVLDDVDAARVGGAGEAPGDRVVARDAAAALQRWRPGSGSAHRARSLMIGQHSLTCSGVSHSPSMPFRRMRVDAALDVAHVVQGVAEVQHAALAEHDVVVEVLATGLPRASATARRGAALSSQR